MNKFFYEKILFREMGHEKYIDFLRTMRMELQKRIAEKQPKEKWRNLARKVATKERFLRGDFDDKEIRELEKQRSVLIDLK